jgi:hypothetical protein
MGFMDKVKSTTTSMVSSGQAKIDNAQAKRQAEGHFEHLGQLVYNERMGRAPADHANQVETTINSLHELEGMHPEIFVPGDPGAVGAAAPPAGSFIPTSAGQVGESSVDAPAMGQPMGAPTYAGGQPAPGYAPQPAGYPPQQQGFEQQPAPGYVPQPAGGIPQPVPGFPPPGQPAPGFPPPAPGMPQPVPGFPPPGTGFPPPAPDMGVAPGFPQAAPFDPAAAQGVPPGGFIPTAAAPEAEAEQPAE